MSAEHRIVGIDLGTTHSLVAWVPEGKELQPQILKTREGHSLLPSVVSWDGDHPVVGYAAKEIMNAAHPVFSIKRLLGKSFAEVQTLRSRLPYRILSPTAHSESFQVDLGVRQFNPVEISAMILKELKLSAQEALGYPVDRAVITVPAYFNDIQRQATRLAGRLAGWNVVRLLNEPTAAALAYGLGREFKGSHLQDQIIIVFDLGGGTFDLSILKLSRGIFEVLATQGDTLLGGDDFDQAIVGVVEREWLDQWGIHFHEHPELHAEVLLQAEKVKIALTQSSQATMTLSLEGYPFYQRQWTLAEFETLIDPLIQRMRQPCESALRDAGLTFSRISQVILVGGSVRVPAVQAFAKEVFQNPIQLVENPEEVVAAGAAIQGALLAGHGSDTEALLLDVVPLSLGIETYGGLVSRLIPRNTKIPVIVKEVFTTFMDHQTGVDIHVLQGEREKASDNQSLARFQLKDLNPLPAGFPRIEVTFLVDADGILQVSALDQRTGKEQVIEVKPSLGLCPEEIQELFLPDEQSQKLDQNFRACIEARQAAEWILRAVEKHWEEADLSSEQRQVIDHARQNLQNVLLGEDSEAIRQASFQLDRLTTHWAEQLLQKSSEISGK